MQSWVPLSHTAINALFSTTWRNAGVRPRRAQLFHDLITHTLLRSLRCGIVVIGVVDAFVYAHNHRCRNLDNPGNFGDCTEGRIRLVTAITPTYAHAYQSLAWRDACSLFTTRNFVCQLPKPGTRIFLTLVPQPVKKATTSKDGPFTQMEELAALRAKPPLDGASSTALSMED